MLVCQRDMGPLVSLRDHEFLWPTPCTWLRSQCLLCYSASVFPPGNGLICALMWGTQNHCLYILHMHIIVYIYIYTYKWWRHLIIYLSIHPSIYVILCVHIITNIYIYICSVYKHVCTHISPHSKQLRWNHPSRCSHAVVVVALGAELLATELEGGDLGGCGNDS